MKTLYFTENCRSNIMIDDKTNSAKELENLCISVRSIYRADSDLEIRLPGDRSRQTVLKAQEGDIILTFYGINEPVVIKNNDLKRIINDILSK